MHKFEVVLALEAIAQARKEWGKATRKFNADVEGLMTRLLNEAAVNRMSQSQVAEALGVTQTRVRKLMRDHGLNPKDGRNLLASKAGETLTENAALLGVEPHEFDLTSPLAYLPMGQNLRKFLETNKVTGEELEALDQDEPVVHGVNFWDDEIGCRSLAGFDTPMLISLDPEKITCDGCRKVLVKA